MAHGADQQALLRFARNDRRAARAAAQQAGQRLHLQTAFRFVAAVAFEARVIKHGPHAAFEEIATLLFRWIVRPATGADQDQQNELRQAGEQPRQFVERAEKGHCVALASRGRSTKPAGDPV